MAYSSSHPQTRTVNFDKQQSIFESDDAFCQHKVELPQFYVNKSLLLDTDVV